MRPGADSEMHAPSQPRAPTASRWLVLGEDPDLAGARDPAYQCGTVPGRSSAVPARVVPRFSARASSRRWPRRQMSGKLASPRFAPPKRERDPAELSSQGPPRLDHRDQQSIRSGHRLDSLRCLGQTPRRRGLEVLRRIQSHRATIGDKAYNGLSKTTPEQLSLFEALKLKTPAKPV